MKRSIWMLIGLFFLAACASPTAAVQTAPTAASATNVPLSSPDAVIASAEAVPAQTSEMAFTISALVKEIPVKEGDVVQTGQTLITLNTPDLEYAVISAEQDYNSKTLDAELQKAEKVLYVNPNTGRRSWYSLPREVYEKALAKADQSKAVWDSAIANLAEATLLAPFDGTVVSVKVTPGELVQVNQVVLTIATLDHLQIVTTDLSEHDIARVKVGQTANITIDSLDTTVTGKVTRISPISEIVGGDVVFPVTIELDKQPDGLLWGMTSEVEIQTK